MFDLEKARKILAKAQCDDAETEACFLCMDELEEALAELASLRETVAKWDDAFSIIPPSRLRTLADWFDQDYSAKEAQANTMRGRGVQKDLRRLAAATEAAARAAKGEAT